MTAGRDKLQDSSGGAWRREARASLPEVDRRIAKAKAGAKITAIQRRERKLVEKVTAFSEAPERVKASRARESHSYLHGENGGTDLRSRRTTSLVLFCGVMTGRQRLG